MYYAYPDESDLNYPEIYGKLSYSWFKGKLWYSQRRSAAMQTDDDAHGYVQRSERHVPMPAEFLDSRCTSGYSTGDYWDDVDRR